LSSFTGWGIIHRPTSVVGWFMPIVFPLSMIDSLSARYTLMAYSPIGALLFSCGIGLRDNLSEPRRANNVENAFRST
jgi:hypothetical protein